MCRQRRFSLIVEHSWGLCSEEPAETCSKNKAAAPRTGDSHRPSDKNTARINIHAAPSRGSSRAARGRSSASNMWEGARREEEEECEGGREASLKADAGVRQLAALGRRRHWEYGRRMKRARARRRLPSPWPFWPTAGERSRLPRRRRFDVGGVRRTQQYRWWCTAVMNLFVVWSLLCCCFSAGELVEEQLSLVIWQYASKVWTYMI